MGQVEFECMSLTCPGRLTTESGDVEEVVRWWSPVKGSRKSGYEATEPECPQCGTPGQETGQREF